MGAQTRILLGRLAALYPILILSGCSRTDVLGKLTGVGVACVIGNHGAETEANTLTGNRRVAQWKSTLEREVGALPGVWVEDKGLSLAVHYRQSRRKAEVRRRILAATRNLEQVRVEASRW